MHLSCSQSPGPELAGGFNLALLWELLSDGMARLQDELLEAEAGGGDEGLPDRAAKEAIRRLAAAQQAAEEAGDGGPVGTSPREREALRCPWEGGGGAGAHHYLTWLFNSNSSRWL